MRKSLSVILLITCFASFASATSIDHPNFVESTKRSIDFNLKGIEQAAKGLKGRIPLPIAAPDLALAEMVWDTAERRKALDLIADAVSLIRKDVVGLISLDGDAFATAVAGINEKKKTLLEKCNALLRATPQTRGGAAAGPLAATPPVHTDPEIQSVNKQRLVKIFYQQVDKKLRDELQVELPPIGDLQKNSLETLEYIHTILIEFHKIKMPLADRELAEKNRQLADNLILFFRLVTIFYQEDDKKIWDEFQVELTTIGDLQKKSPETLECIHTMLTEVQKIKMPLADRELAEKNRQLAHELIRLFRDVLKFKDPSLASPHVAPSSHSEPATDRNLPAYASPHVAPLSPSEPAVDGNLKEPSMPVYYIVQEFEKEKVKYIAFLANIVKELRHCRQLYESAKTELIAAHLKNFDKKLAVLLAQHRVNTSDVPPGGVSLKAGASSAPVGKTPDQQALEDAQIALRENESSIPRLKQDVDAYQKKAASRVQTCDEEIAEREKQIDLLNSEQKIAKDYFKEALGHYLKDSPHTSKYTHFLNLGKPAGSSFLSLPSDIIITPQFFVLLDILKMIKADQSSFYFAHPKFAQYLGISCPSLEITFSEALAKWGLEKDLTIELPGSSFGQYRGRTAIHLHNMVKLLKRHNHTKLAISLERTIIDSAVPEPLLKMITDCFESECVADVLAVHSMPAEMVFVTTITDIIRNQFVRNQFVRNQFGGFINVMVFATTITDIIRNQFGGFINVSATPRAAASPEVAAAPLVEPRRRAMSCGGRGRGEVFGKAENLDDILKMHIIDPRKRMLDVNNYGSINIQTPYGVNMAVNMQELLLSVNMSLLGNMPIPGSFTLGYLAETFSASPPTWQGTLDNTFKSMGLSLRSTQFEDLFRSFMLKHSANSLFKIALTQERADKIMYLCHVGGKGIDSDLENCRPHLLGFFRYVMQKANVYHPGWPAFKAAMAKIFKDPFHLQARISMIPDLFHNSPECKKTLTKNSGIPFDEEPFMVLLTRLLAPTAATAGQR